ncbi:MAG: glycosyltransferase family 2 protein [Acidobacteria bacterium]|nr:glycosyltransferase family 2 protein [Acidobacteriota bacterium]MBV9478762.1 glycosyltransferase family 2 protein [Acidobacteriota bacterium]
MASRLTLKRHPGAHVVAVVPAYNVAEVLGGVLRAIPPLFTSIIVVDDASRDDTAAVAERYAQLDPRILVVRHETNRGVGGAMITGFVKALEWGADVVVKVDGDGQMPLWIVTDLIEPLIDGSADYTKGNRFRDFEAIRAMPFVRRIGNVALSFLAKAATGYWHCFDPTNGFVAIRADVLSQLPLRKIDPTYFFETSMLSHLYILGAVVKEVPMPARYAGEPSSLSIPRVIRQFPGRLLASLARRIVLKNFVYDFNLESFQLLAGLPLLLAGLVYGGYNWWWYTSHKLAAPTGTVVLPALAIMLGMQLLIAAVNLDLQSIPREPLNHGAIGEGGG